MIFIKFSYEILVMKPSCGFAYILLYYNYCIVYVIQFGKISKVIFYQVYQYFQIVSTVGKKENICKSLFLPIQKAE